jgi:DNA-directed RNA polymerase sigma subunit (sigma70/sigma32)
VKTSIPKKLRKKLAPKLPEHERWLIRQAQAGLETALDELVVRHVKVIARLAEHYTPKRAREKEEEAMLAQALDAFERTVHEASTEVEYPDLAVLFAHTMERMYGKDPSNSISLVREALQAHLVSCPLPLDPYHEEDERPLIDTVTQNTFPSAIDVLSRLDHSDFVRKALELKQLKKKERLVLELLYLEELSIREVTERTGLPTGKVKQLEARARRVIRGEMRDPRE